MKRILSLLPGAAAAAISLMVASATPTFAQSALDTTCEQASAIVQRMAGLVSLSNAATGLGVLMVGWGIIYFFGKIIVQIGIIFAAFFMAIPMVVYEIVAYATTAGLWWWGYTMSPTYSPWVGALGCMFFAGCVAFTGSIHELKPNWTGYTLLLTVVWAAVAMTYHSSLIGFIAVGGLMAAAGFVADAGGLWYAIGFKDEKAVERGTLVAFFILILYVGLRVARTAIPFIDVFETGALFLGSFVGYCGLLILSSKYYPGGEGLYPIMQLVTVIACAGAVGIGLLFGIDELLKVGGSFAVLFLVDKYAEIPKYNMMGFAVWSLIGGTLFWGVGRFVAANPELFRPYLLVGV